MGTDLFRISTSREIDRSRYLRALLSAGCPSFKRNLPPCLLPDKPQTSAANKLPAEDPSYPDSKN